MQRLAPRHQPIGRLQLQLRVRRKSLRVGEEARDLNTSVVVERRSGKTHNNRAAASYAPRARIFIDGRVDDLPRSFQLASEEKVRRGEVPVAAFEASRNTQIQLLDLGRT